MSDTNSSTPVATKDRTPEIAVIAIVLTLAFHFLLAEYMFGFAFAIFTSLLAIAMIVIAHMRAGAKNAWAFLFLIPVALGSATHILYASEVSRALAFFITLGSLTLFAYWYTRPKIDFKNVISFWPRHLFIDTLWPYPSLGAHLSKVKNDKRLGSILLGIGISIPFLLIFLSLFTSADQLFAKSFSNVFETAETANLAVKIVRDFIVGAFFLSSGFLMLARMNKRIEDNAYKMWDWLNQTALATFLVMLNLLFMIFVGFQAAYFFGGEALVKAQGLTYADYAVSGFFELLFVAGLVFGITWFIYRGTEMRNRLSGLLSVVLIAQTGVIIVSAMSRLLLYIDTYGLTLSRFWAAFCITLIGLVLLASAVGTIAKVSYAKMAKLIFLGSLMLTSLVLIFNIEGFIAKYNIERYFNGETKVMDVHYLFDDLSIDAIPQILVIDQYDWYKEFGDSKDNPFVFLTSRFGVMNEEINIFDFNYRLIKNDIDQRFLGASISHYKALGKLWELQSK
ncbi:MAG: DUF4173 domain-containing protein [Patescibacteria group bacterium]|nr:DUF4173 domain-containing protein [Patescibacteria group bacterium]